MLSKPTHNLYQKEAMLRGVFNDNLRIAGKRVDDELPVKRASFFVIVRWMLPALLIGMLSLMPGLSSSVSVNAELSLNAFPSLPPLPPVQEQPGIYAEPDALWQSALVNPDWLDQLSRSSGPNLDTPGNRSMDYSLLFSGDDRVRLLSLFGLNIKTLVIDPGHGGSDPGAIGGMGTQEKDITLDVALKLKERLRRGANYNILLTRHSDRTLSLAKRVEFAKEHKADLFISIHVNALPNQSVNAIETYYFGPPLNAETLQLAEQENKGSLYSIGELSGIIQDIGNTVKRQESEMLAASIQKSLYRNVRNLDTQVFDVGIKMAPFVVLSKVAVPSVLVEISCLSKEEEEARLNSTDYRDKIASFIEEGIIAYLINSTSKS